LRDVKIAFIASECFPLVKIGGLGEVVFSLSLALKKIGVDVSVFLPFYQPISGKNFNIKPLFKKEKLGYGIFQYLLKRGCKATIPIYLIKHPFISQGGIYLSPSASSLGNKKEAQRFLIFSLISLQGIKKLNLFPDVIHLHDWHTAIAAFIMRNLSPGIQIPTLLTIHNLGYQGVYPAKVVNEVLGTDFKRKVNCLKEGIINSDFITTVSPAYAQEILTKQFGCGLDKFLRKRKKDLKGILNGIDINRFNPRTDKYVIKNYSCNSLHKKEENKVFLLKKHFQSKNFSSPLLSLISRLAFHKGLDLIIEVFEQLMRKDVYFILLGKGEEKYEKFFKKMNRKYKGKFYAHIAYDEKLAHQIYAGSDIFLIPSLFEPCGLTQMISQRYGTIPLGRAVGGIKDTIEDGETGFLFKRYNANDLLNTIEKALIMYNTRKKKWKMMQIKDMKKDFSWAKSAKEYLEIYRNLKLET